MSEERYSFTLVVETRKGETLERSLVVREVSKIPQKGEVVSRPDVGGERSYFEVQKVLNLYDQNASIVFGRNNENGILVMVKPYTASARMRSIVEYMDKNSLEGKSTELDQLDLSIRGQNTLGNARIRNVGQLSEQTAEELLKIRGFGRTQLREVRDILRLYGLELRKTE